MTGPIEILHRDDDVVVVNKPAGLAVHRGWSNDDAHALQIVRDWVGRYVFPVHRLDRATSGVLLFALTKEAAAALQSQWSSGGVEKRYVALVRGRPLDVGMVDHPLPRAEGKPKAAALTRFWRLGTSSRGVCTAAAVERDDAPPMTSTTQAISAVLALPITGRLHQIRKHFKHLAHPLVGDVRYGKGELNRWARGALGLERLALHAVDLTFFHPRDRQRLRVVAPLPRDLRIALARLELLESVEQNHHLGISSGGSTSGGGA